MAANIIVGAAAAGAAYYVLSHPARRRAAWHVARRLLAVAGPWLLSEARQAWAQSASPADPLPRPRGRRTGAL